MPRIGYALSGEEHAPTELVRLARRAEEIGFAYALVSDHFHPWTDSQGHAPFVWSVIGGIAETTERLCLGTGVTCPTIRTHPAIVAQAAATAAAMMPGRFFFGVGSGENLNEHILGDAWPPAYVRIEMMEEAIRVIRKLWQGDYTNHRGRYYAVQEARLYTLPDELPAIYVAAAGPTSAEVAARCGDGLINTSPDQEVVEAFEEAGGQGPKLAQLTVCWAESEEEARRTAFEIWPNSAIKGELSQELPLPRHFEQAARMLTEEDVAESVVCGPEPDLYLEGIEKYVQAGYDHVYLHQVGQDQEGFFRFCEREILPRYASADVSSSGSTTSSSASVS